MKEDGVIVIRFEGVNGSPVVSGICVRKAPKLSGSFICISLVCFVILWNITVICEHFFIMF